MYIGPDSYDVITRFLLTDSPTRPHQIDILHSSTSCSRVFRLDHVRFRDIPLCIESSSTLSTTTLFSSFEIYILRGLNWDFFSTVERDEEGH